MVVVEIKKELDILKDFRVEELMIVLQFVPLILETNSFVTAEWKFVAELIIGDCSYKQFL